MVLLQTPSKANQVLKTEVYQRWVDIKKVILNDYETTECPDQPAFSSSTHDLFKMWLLPKVQLICNMQITLQDPGAI